MTVRYLIALAPLLLAVGCGTAPVSAPDVSRPKPVYEEDQPTATQAPTAPSKPATPPPDPNAALLQRAGAALAAGDYEASLVLLERAQRIDPGNADIYLRLAQTYAAKGDAALAGATAQRGLLYCEGRGQCDALRRYAN